LIFDKQEALAEDTIVARHRNKQSSASNDSKLSTKHTFLLDESAIAAKIAKKNENVETFLESTLEKITFSLQVYIEDTLMDNKEQ